MRHKTLCALIGLGCAFGGTALAACRPSSAQAATPVSSCLGTADPDQQDEAALLTEYMTELVTSSETSTVATRNRYQLPAGQAADVALVTDDVVCQQAAAAYAADVAQAPDTAVVQPVYVVRVGATRYVVFHPDVKAGEFRVYVIFDETFHRLASYVS